MKLTIARFLKSRKQRGVSWPTEHQIRNWIYQNFQDFRTCVFRLGRAVLIDEDLFGKWHGSKKYVETLIPIPEEEYRKRLEHKDKSNG